MISTTAEYKTAISALSRNIKPKVYIYFDGESSPPVLFDSDNIAGIDFLEEVQAEGDNPLGTVSANEIKLTLRNDDHQFNPNNISSTYYGKLTPNLLIKPYYGIKTNGSFEWISLGSFWTGYWGADSTSVVAEVVCNDRLFILNQEDVPLIPTMQNITRYQVFEALFESLGLTSAEYDIDSELSNYTVPVAYYPDGDVHKALNYLTNAFSCTVFMTRDNIVKVLDNSTTVSSVKTFNDTDLIISSNAPQNFDEIYSDVEITYKHHTVGEKAALLIVNDIVIDAAGVTYTDLKFTSGPIAFVTDIQITEIPHIAISSFSIGTWGMTIIFTNSASAEQTVNIEVHGYPLEIVENKLTVRDATAYALLGDKARILPLDNYLVQSYSVANTQANLILPIVADSKAYVEANTRGDMSVELADTIKINDVTNKILNTDIIPIRFKYKYDGGLTCDIKGIKKSVRDAI